MASPQIENGYTRIANEILDKLCLVRINGSEYRVCLFLIRKTYGFNKSQDRISISQFQKGTNMDRRLAIRTTKELIRKKILVKTGSIYKFNKNWEEWVGASSPRGELTPTARGQLTTTSRGQLTTHKRKKDTITKDISKVGTLQGKIHNLIELFEPINPSYEKIYKNKTQRAALQRLVDKYGRDKVRGMILALPEITSKPYAPRITKPLELEENLGKLVIFSKQEKNKTLSNNFSFN